MSDNLNSIYLFQPEKPNVDTSTIFIISNEGDKLRVRTENLNILFSKLDKESFDKWYNEFRRYLNLDFSPVVLEHLVYTFTEIERIEIEQKIICLWLYHFTINNYKRILIRKDDFEHPYTPRELYHYLNNKFGTDNEMVFKLAPHILRMTSEAFAKTIDNYKKWVAMW